MIYIAKCRGNYHKSAAISAVTVRYAEGLGYIYILLRSIKKKIMNALLVINGLLLTSNISRYVISRLVASCAETLITVYLLFTFIYEI
jgi:uncharacterized membrane protein